MNEYKTGYDNGWADCTRNRRENERTLLEGECMARNLSPNGSARDLLGRLILWERADVIAACCEMTIAQRR